MDDRGSMLSLFGQMMKLPSEVFVSGLELFAKSFRDLQRRFVRGVDKIVFEVSRTDPVVLSFERDGNASEQASTSSNAKEKHIMPDQDLGGDDLKVVNYSIFFTKRDLETTLQPNRQEVVDYATDGASFGATKILALSNSAIPYPEKWSDNRYPPDFYTDPPPTTITVDDIPDSDQKYISFLFEVIDRVPKQEKDYDKRKTRAIENIETTLEQISGKIGP
jgi:hypothetical protein